MQKSSTVLTEKIGVGLHKAARVYDCLRIKPMNAASNRAKCCFPLPQSIRIKDIIGKIIGLQLRQALNGCIKCVFIAKHFDPALRTNKPFTASLSYQRVMFSNARFNKRQHRVCCNLQPFR